MLAEIFMIWLESLRRQEISAVPSSSSFVPFNRANFGSFAADRRRRR